MDLGPQQPDVLYLQQQHRSSSIWAGRDPGHLLPRRNDIDWSIILPECVQRVLLRAGFYGLYRVGHIQLDHAFITALVERWRQETHTFHLPVGECTITLQDVVILLGLPVDGQAVTAPPLDVAPADLCERLLGIRPPSEAITGSKLKLTWVGDFLRQPPNDGADDFIVERYARAWILYSLGGSILTDKSTAFVKVSYLRLLEDINKVGQYSWGGASLALLYREMCRATPAHVKQIAGPLILLQLWGWERLSHLRPERASTPPILEEHIDRAPHGCRWQVTLLLSRTPKHVLCYYRDQLDSMRPEQMIWQPYTPDVIALLPAYCVSGQAIWRTRAPLICFELVEWHLPDRVMRQFGRQQAIPEKFDTSEVLHDIDLRGSKLDTDWKQQHGDFITYWDNRRDHIVDADVLQGPLQFDDAYMVWYRTITRRFIVAPPERPPELGAEPVGATLEILGDSFARIHTLVQRRLRLSTIDPTFEDILDVTRSALVALRQEHRLSIDPLLVPQPVAAPIPRAKVSRAAKARQRRAATIAPSSTVEGPSPLIPPYDPATTTPGTSTTAGPSTTVPSPHISPPHDISREMPPHDPTTTAGPSTTVPSPLISPPHDPAGTSTAAGLSTMVLSPPITSSGTSFSQYPDMDTYVSFITSSDLSREFSMFRSPHTPSHAVAPTSSPSTTHSPLPTEGLTEVPTEPEEEVDLVMEAEAESEGVGGGRGRARGRGKGRGQGRPRAGVVVVADGPANEGRPVRKKKKPSCGTH